MKSDTFKRFLLFEEQENFFDIEYKGFKIWEFVRGYIYIEIEMIYNGLQPLFSQQKKDSKRQKNTFKSILKKLKIFFLKDVDYIFLNNPRRVKQSDGKYYCIYTDLMIDLLKDKNKCVTFEDPYWVLNPTTNVSHFEPVKTESICYLDYVEHLYRIKRYLSKNKHIELHNILLNIKDKVEEEFECDLSNIFKLVEDRILYMLYTYNFYRRIIVRTKPKSVFEFYDIFPSKIVINKIAKELNVPIIEIQHGIVTKKNPIFLKYGNMDRDYECLPDYVLSYGKKLLNLEYMPIKKENIFYIGSLFLNKKINEYKTVQTDKKNILFVSQSNLGKHLSACAAELAELLKSNDEYQIIYKMHPYEIGANYDCLNKKNITVINDRNKDLYYYQSISCAQIGVYSTGLYEGLNFGLNTFILSNYFGFDEIKDIIKESNSVFYVKDAKDIYNIIKEKKLEKNIENNYWEKVDYNKIVKIINKITCRH